ncbi:MAG: histidine kinase dimerization/phospho-acceptor domain-containing protein [Devosia sp.]
MNAEWIGSPSARRVFEHWADARPAWLWSGDGSELLWRNTAARLFGARLKKGTLRPGADPVPIKGQVQRLIRLGVLGRPSLSRIRFLAGQSPLSATCACTPLLADDGATALLIVGVDPLDPELLGLETSGFGGRGSATILPEGARYVLVDADGTPVDASPGAVEIIAPLLADQAAAGHPPEAIETVEIEGAGFSLGRFRASPADDLLLVLMPLARPESGRLDAIRAEEGLDVLERDAPEPEPLLPMGLPEAPLAEETHSEDTPSDEPDILLADEPPHASLFDPAPEGSGFMTPEIAALAERRGGLRAIEPGDAEGEPALPEPRAVAETLPFPGPTRRPDADEIAAIIAFAEDEEVMEEDDPPFPLPDPAPASEPHRVAEPAPAEPPAMELDQAQEVPPPAADFVQAVNPAADRQPSDKPGIAAEPEAEAEPRVTFRIIGRGLRPRRRAETIPTAEPAPAPGPAAPAPEAVESEAEPAGRQKNVTERADVALDAASRHNFDELSRILADRVGAQPLEPVPEATSTDASRQPPTQPAPPPTAAPPGPSEGGLISLNGETFILNRLPLGILVFRDQQVLFANRALVELLGHASIDGLRTAGIPAIFPEAMADGPGPVTRLMRADGETLPVNARLQSITWQGKPAVMLSASLSEARPSHEAAVRAFAELSAAARKEGFVAADRNGVITQVSSTAQAALGPETAVIGQPLSVLLDEGARAALRVFLEQPARFAETVRPSLVTPTVIEGMELALFAEGQAGIIAGYFGFLRPPQTVESAPEPRADTGMLGRISRGVRRPLNTIIGFADLIRSSAFGQIENQRYVEYARDIKAAGQEIALLVDELDDFTRLRDGRFPARPSDIDLAGLLDSCLSRLRTHAGQRRVLVRSAVSERLPHVRADRASLGQAILNLLASAIAQSPAGSTVILSAQPDEDGGLSIQVRDSSTPPDDPAERFVVFRDGADREGQPLAPVPSSVGLALTRSLLAVNSCKLAVAPTPGSGTLFSILVPSEIITRP